MPFKSASQMRGAFSGAFGPSMKDKAKEWAAETPHPGSLPDRVGDKHKKVSKRAAFIEHIASRHRK